MKNLAFIILGIMAVNQPIYALERLFSLDEIKQLISQGDYDTAMNAIRALPQQQVNDRHQLLHTVLEAWKTDDTVSAHAKNIKKAADSLVGGHRNVIYQKVNNRLATGSKPVDTVTVPVQPEASTEQPIIVQPIIDTKPEYTEPITVSENIVPPQEITSPDSIVAIPVLPVNEEPIASPTVPAQQAVYEPIQQPDQNQLVNDILIQPIIEIPHPKQKKSRPGFMSRMFPYAAGAAILIAATAHKLFGTDEKTKKDNAPIVPPAPPLGEYPAALPAHDIQRLHEDIRNFAANRRPLPPPPPPFNGQQSVPPALGLAVIAVASSSASSESAVDENLSPKPLPIDVSEENKRASRPNRGPQGFDNEELDSLFTPRPNKKMPDDPESQAGKIERLLREQTSFEQTITNLLEKQGNITRVKHIKLKRKNDVLVQEVAKLKASLDSLGVEVPEEIEDMQETARKLQSKVNKHEKLLGELEALVGGTLTMQIAKRPDLAELAPLAQQLQFPSSALPVRQEGIAAEEKEEEKEESREILQFDDHEVDACIEQYRAAINDLQTIIESRNSSKYRQALNHLEQIERELISDSPVIRHNDKLRTFLTEAGYYPIESFNKKMQDLGEFVLNPQPKE